jgi:hypothetical protein
MARSKFRLAGYREAAKDLSVYGPARIGIYIDVDDIDLSECAVDLRKMFAILNDHWDDPQYRLPKRRPTYEEAQEIMCSLITPEK